MQYRKEEDLLGMMDVPADAYYGIHTLRALNNFQISREKIADNPEWLLMDSEGLPQQQAKQP